MLLIIGLGNPGLAYKDTYHNMGFITVDKLAFALGVDFKHRYCKAKVAEKFVNGEKIVIAKPQTYMNLSGESVRELMGKYKASPRETIVVYDDIDIPCGTLRLRQGGSAGTHNGMRNIIALAGSCDFPRIRVGIGKPQGEMDLVNFVLSKVRGENYDKLSDATERASKALLAYIDVRDIARVGADYNG